LSDDESKLFVAGHTQGFVIVDLLSDGYPFQIVDVGTSSSDVAVAADSSTAFVGTPSEVRIFQILDPAGPVLLATAADDFCEYPLVELSPEGDRLFVACGDQVRTIDVSDPLNPVQLGSRQFSTWVEDLFISHDDTKLYVVSTFDSMLEIMDIRSDQ